MENLVILDERELLGQNFVMYGDMENPLFLAKDVAEWIGHSDVSTMLRNIDEEEKVTNNVCTLGGVQKSWFLTEDGFYEVLMLSRKPIAKQFKKAVKEILKTIRKTGKYETPQSKMYVDEYKRKNQEIKERNAKSREAIALMRLADKVESRTYQQVLYSYSAKALTGENILPLPALDRKTYSATEIGEMLGISAHKVGMLANAHNLKIPQYGAWFHDKAKSANKEVQTFRYYIEVVEVLKRLAEVA